MREYVTVEKTYTDIQLKSITCVICGAEAIGGDWKSSIYKVNDVDVRVEVRNNKRTNDPDSGWISKCVIDMCPVCFRDKLIPWIESQGGIVEREDFGF